jgi:hypothetical protein
MLILQGIRQMEAFFIQPVVLIMQTCNTQQVYYWSLCKYSSCGHAFSVQRHNDEYHNYDTIFQLLSWAEPSADLPLYFAARIVFKGSEDSNILSRVSD